MSNGPTLWVMFEGRAYACGPVFASRQVIRLFKCSSLLTWNCNQIDNLNTNRTKEPHLLRHLHAHKTGGRSAEAMSSLGQSILMALTVTVNKFASSNVQAVQVHRRQGNKAKKTTSSTTATTTNDFGRRGLLLSTIFATPPISDSGGELLKKYLKKSEENKAKNDKERMDSYYKRNYKDYFEFEESTLRAKKGELTEGEKGILDWLQKNK